VAEDKLVLDTVSVTVPGPDGPQAVLRSVSATVGAAEMVAIVGPSGSGKTTLLNVAGGLEPAFDGRVLLDGVPVWSRPDGERAAIRGTSIGFVFQDANLIQGLSAEENLILPLLLHSRHGETPRDVARALLGRIGLEAKARTRVERLSGGERQRVATVRALAGEPAMVLVDEPTGNLDDENARRVIDILLDYRSRHHATMLVATHDARLIEAADRVFRLEDGTLHEAS